MIQVINEDCRTFLRYLPSNSFQSCVTSPPYYGLRDYGHADQMGAETTPDAYVAAMVGLFREVRRVLKVDGTLWLNLGDSYNPTNRGENAKPRSVGPVSAVQAPHLHSDLPTSKVQIVAMKAAGFKNKDLLLVPHRVAIALQADGWYLRSAIVWAKPNPMPESIRDRPTSSYEMVFLLAKSEKYFYDADAIAEPAVADHPSGNGFKRDARKTYADDKGARGNEQQWTGVGGTRNARNVWTINTKPYKGAHFATMPLELAERCVKASSRPGDTILDPFGGAGTTGVAAAKNGRSAMLIELNAKYAAMARARCAA